MIYRRHRGKACSSDTAKRIVDLLIADPGISSELMTRSLENGFESSLQKRQRARRRNAQAWLASREGS